MRGTRRASIAKSSTFLGKAQHSTPDRAGTLLPLVARGDEATYRRFCEVTNGLLFGLLLRILGHTQTAEEVLAEVYEEVSWRAALFSKQTERPLTWLGTHCTPAGHRTSLRPTNCQ